LALFLDDEDLFESFGEAPRPCGSSGQLIATL